MRNRETPTRAERLNDNSWQLTTILCLAGTAGAGWRGRGSPRALAAGFLCGVLYEELLEWADHGWLQSQPVEGFEYFRWRHGRHHQRPDQHHALQPATIWIPVVTGLLSPALVALRSRKGSTRSAGSGLVAGFLLAHATLNIEHYDIHATRKIVPEPIRTTYYYREVERLHLAHHDGVESRIYGITNPWLDMLLDRLGASRRMDEIFGRAAGLARYLDPVWLKLDPAWRAVSR
jgi:hypothetical protein